MGATAGRAGGEPGTRLAKVAARWICSHSARWLGDLTSLSLYLSVCEMGIVAQKCQ